MHVFNEISSKDCQLIKYLRKIFFEFFRDAMIRYWGLFMDKNVFNGYDHFFYFFEIWLKWF